MDCHCQLHKRIAHKQRGGESGSVGEQEESQNNEVKCSCCGAFFFPTFRKMRRDTFTYGPATGCYWFTHTHVEKLAVCMQRTFNLLWTSASNTLQSLMVFIWAFPCPWVNSLHMTIKHPPPVNYRVQMWRHTLTHSWQTPVVSFSTLSNLLPLWSLS